MPLPAHPTAPHNPAAQAVQAAGEDNERATEPEGGSQQAEEWVSGVPCVTGHWRVKISAG